jgi:iron complex transport system substrate-binding protein
VTRLPICTEPKLSLEGSSAEINERVKSVLEASLSVYRVHTDRLEELRRMSS